MRVVLEDLGYTEIEKCYGSKRVLHLAPEIMTHKYLSNVFGSGYYGADLSPEKYPHCEALRLALPQGFQIFPEGYFHLILHNHVLEHIPGSYTDHINCFVKLLKRGGHMVFTLPYVNPSKKTVEGGENLASDAERLKAHGQADHYKTFGSDFLEHMKSLPGNFEEVQFEKSLRTELSAPKDVVYLYRK